MKNEEKTATVIGCGVVGVCTAWSLIKQGIKHVTLIDESEIPRPYGGASVDGGRAIRYSYAKEEGYTIMINDAYDTWYELFNDLGQVLYTETGILDIQPKSPNSTNPKFQSSHPKDSYDTWQKFPDKINAQYQYLQKEDIPKFHPFIKYDDIEFAIYSPKAGVLHAYDIVENTYKWVKSQSNTTVLCGPDYKVIKFETSMNENNNSLNTEQNHCTLKNGQIISSDIMIFAINAFTSTLFPEVIEKGLLHTSREEVVYFMPPDDEIEQWKKCPILFEDSCDTSFYYLPYAGGTGTYGIKASTHMFDNTKYDFFTEDFKPIPGFNEPIIKWVQDRFGNRGEKSPLQPNLTKVCYYDVSPEERFQMYFLNSNQTAMSLFGFSGHGFKFGALIGKATASAATHQKAPNNVKKWLAGETTLSFSEVE